MEKEYGLGTYHVSVLLTSLCPWQGADDFAAGVVHGNDGDVVAAALDEAVEKQKQPQYQVSLELPD